MFKFNYIVGIKMKIFLYDSEAVGKFIKKLTIENSDAAENLIFLWTHWRLDNKLALGEDITLINRRLLYIISS